MKMEIREKMGRDEEKYRERSGWEVKVEIEIEGEIGRKNYPISLCILSQFYLHISAAVMFGTMGR